MPKPTTALPCAIAVMAKASEPGRTKTRLAPPLSLEEAAQLNTVFLKDIVENIARAAETTPIATYLAFGPPGSERFFYDELPPVDGLIEAWLGDFGKCLSATTEGLFARGHAAACVLNSDSPTLPTTILIDIAQRLAAPGDRAVIGPADDGGYYVLGLKAAHRRLFEDIDWSTERVFEQTLQRAEEIGLPVEILPTWYDVDDGESLRRLRKDLFDPDEAAAPHLTPNLARHTRALLERMMHAEGLNHRLRSDRVEVS